MSEDTKTQSWDLIQSHDEIGGKSARRLRTLCSEEYSKTVNAAA